MWGFSRNLMGVYPKAMSLKQTLKKIHHLNMPQQGAELENITGNGQQAVTACMKYASLGCKYDIFTDARFETILKVFRALNAKINFNVELNQIEVAG